MIEVAIEAVLNGEKTSLLSFNRTIRGFTVELVIRKKRIMVDYLKTWGNNCDHELNEHSRAARSLPRYERDRPRRVA